LNTRYGWTVTGWPETGVPARYHGLVEHLRAGLPLGTTDQINIPPSRPGELPSKGQVVLRCGCERIIYVSRGTAKEGGIACRWCGSDFTSSQEL
jgi:hypothetical protein